MKTTIKEEVARESEQYAQALDQGLPAFLKELLVKVDEMLDKRLVRTQLETVRVVLKFRNNGRTVRNRGKCSDDQCSHG